MAEGVADEAMRHAISKLSHVHFPGSVLSRKRLVRMGEDPRWVFDVGSPAIVGLKQIRAADDVALVPSTSYGAAVAGANIALERGQSVLVLEGQHSSNFHQWRVRAAAAGAGVSPPTLYTARASWCHVQRTVSAMTAGVDVL